jgi:cytochrome c2
MCALLAGCSRSSAGVGAALTGGDARRGAAAIGKYGCGSCHTIQGIAAAHGLVGPPLTGIGDRMYVGGVLRNTPENLIRWIQDPKAVDDKTAMPKLGVTRQEATDIAAYLYSIE